MSKLKGILTAIITPINAKGEIDYDLLGPFLQFQRGGGIDGVVVCGTNGEGTSLTIAERKGYLEAVLAQKGDLSVIAGTGATSLPDAVELTKHANEAGADAVLVLPPFFFKNPTAQGLANYFSAVMEVSAIPVLLYSIPQQTAIPVSDELLDLVEDNPAFGGLKDSQGDWPRTEYLIKRYPIKAVFSGSDDVLRMALSAGACGAISGTANAFPELVTAVRDAIAAGGDGLAEQNKLDDVKRVLARYPLIAANKTVLSIRGVGEMRVRPPLIDLSADQASKMEAQLRELNVL